jgi:hypothetical protein
MFKVSPANLQTFMDTKPTLTPSVIPNFNYVIMVSDWNSLKYFCIFLYCNHHVNRNFLITLYNSYQLLYMYSEYLLMMGNMPETCRGWVAKYSKDK